MKNIILIIIIALIAIFTNISCNYRPLSFDVIWINTDYFINVLSKTGIEIGLREDGVIVWKRVKK